MKHNATEPPRGWSHPARGALGALVIGSALAVTASIVSAEMACHGPLEGGSKMCLTITSGAIADHY